MAVKGEVTYALISSSVAHRIAKGEIAFTKAEATEITLDATPTNQYFTDLMSVSESALIHTNKVSLDSFGFTDAQVTSLAKSIVDSVVFSESVSILLIIERAFSDSFAISDFSAIALHKGLVDTVGFSDGLQNAMSLGKADTVSVNELHSIAIEKPNSDAFSFSDDLQTATIFVRGLADASTLSDEYAAAFNKPATDVFALSESQQKSVALGKDSSFSFGDTQSRVFDKQASEALGVTDSFARVATYIRNFTDTFGLDELVNVSPNWGIEKTNVFSFTENFSYEVRAGHNSVLNSSVLNTYTLNL
jgi:hypothetical protein